MMRLIRSILLLTGIHLLLITSILVFARPDANSDYQLLFIAEASSQGSQIFTADLDGGNLQQLSFNPNYDKGWQNCPVPSPDGQWIGTYSYYLEVETVYNLRTRWGTGEIEFSNYYDNHFCDGISWANGWFYYLHDRTVYRVHPLYPEHPERVLESNLFSDAVYPSPDGQWIMQPDGDGDIVFFHTQKQYFLHFSNVAHCPVVAWSPDSRYVVCEIDTELSYLRLIDTQTMLDTFLPAGTSPAWSMDSRWIAFWQERILFRVRPDGSEQEVLLTLPDEYEIPSHYNRTPIWLPEGSGLLLPSLCIPGEYGAKCTTFHLRLDNQSLTPIIPIFHYKDALEDVVYEMPVSMRDLRLLPPLKMDFDFPLLILISVGLLIVGASLRKRG